MDAVCNYFRGGPSFNTPDYMKVNLRSDLVTFFFQGHGSSRFHATVYAGQQGIDAMVENNLVHAVCPDAPQLLHNIWTYPELEDVDYYPSNPILWLGKALHYTANRYRRIDGAISHASIISKWNVSGEQDVSHHLYWFREMLQSISPDKKVVLFGCSRGAATTFISVSQMTPEEHQRIALVILEAPFDSVTNTIFESAYCPHIQMALLPRLTLYNPDQMTPSEAANFWPNTVPVAFITSNADTRVPKRLTLNLINKIRSYGHTKVHHCELHNSHHMLYPMHNLNDQKIYYDFVNEMYQLYT